MWCTVLYCTVLCGVLYCTVLYCTVLYCTVLYCVVYCGLLSVHCAGRSPGPRTGQHRGGREGDDIREFHEKCSDWKLEIEI